MRSLFFPTPACKSIYIYIPQYKNFDLKKLKKQTTLVGEGYMVELYN